MVGRYGVAAFGWLGTILMVRHLTDDQWGELSFILSLLSLVGFVSDLKLSRVVLAEVLASEEGAGDVVGSYVGLRGAIGLVSYAVALAWVAVGDYSAHVVFITAIAGLNLVVMSAGWGIGLLFQARLWLRSIAWGIFLGQALQFAITVAVIVLDRSSIAAFAWATVANSLFFVVFLLVAGRHGGRLRVRVQPAKWGRLPVRVRGTRVTFSQPGQLGPSQPWSRACSSRTRARSSSARACSWATSRSRRSTSSTRT